YPFRLLCVYLPATTRYQSSIQEAQFGADGGGDMAEARRRYFAAGVCIVAFIAAQTFQELASRFWIPVSHGPRDDLIAYLLPIDRVRAILVASTIVSLMVPFAVVAWRYFKIAPVMSVLGVVFGAAFIGFEISHRSMDFFVVGMKWAREFASTPGNAE